MARSLALILAAALLLISFGCSRSSTMTAEFLRYETLQDGTRVAVVAAPAIDPEPQEITAYVNLDDLKPGELVRIKDIGRDWDQPQWRPAVSVVSLADER